MVAPRNAARDLHIDDAVAHPVAPDGFAQDMFQGRTGDRRRQAQFAQRPVEPVEMGLLVDEPAVLDRDHLIDRVGELVSPILDMDCCVAVRREAAVDIGDS